MLVLAAKARLSGVPIALIAALGRSLPTMTAPAVSWPPVWVPGKVLLWYSRPDAQSTAVRAQATFWYVLPGMAMFLLIPWMARTGSCPGLRP